jgi:hypothetical protein
VVEKTMKKTIVVTLALLAAAAALAAYLLVFEKEDPEERPEDKHKSSAIIPEGAKPAGITLIRSSDTIELEAVPETPLWKMTKPVETFTEPIYISMLVNDFIRLRKGRLIELHPEDLSPYQLDRPQWQIIFRYEDKRPETHLLIGKVNYTRDSLFAKLEDETAVFLIKPQVGEFFDAPLDAFRSKSLLMNVPTNVLSFELKIDDPILKFENPSALEPKLVVQSQVNEKPQWVIVDPVKENADFSMVKNFFNRLKNTSAAEVIDIEEKDLPDYGLLKPRARIIFTDLMGRREQVVFGDEDRERGVVYARNTMLFEVVPIEANLFYSFILSNFRHNRLNHELKMFRISTISLEFPRSPEKNIRLNKKSRGLYEINDESETPVPASRINWIVKPFREDTVVFMHQVEPMPREMSGLDKPQVNIKIYEEERLSIDVSLGDTVTEGTQTFTFVEDHRRGCIVFFSSNFYDIMPLNKEHLAATDEELEKIKERDRRRRKK